MSSSQIIFCFRYSIQQFLEVILIKFLKSFNGPMFIHVAIFYDDKILIEFSGFEVQGI